jgi:hypothetical protein
MSAEWFAAICAGVTLVILWTSTIIGGGMWLAGKFSKLKDDVLKVFAEHEKEDTRRFERINEMLMHEDLKREPEFPRRHRQ